MRALFWSVGLYKPTQFEYIGCAILERKILQEQQEVIAVRVRLLSYEPPENVEYHTSGP